MSVADGIRFWPALRGPDEIVLGEDQDLKRLTWRQSLILLYDMFLLTRAHWRWMMFGLAISTAFAYVGYLADMPAKEVWNWAEKKDPVLAERSAEEFLPEALGFFLVILLLNLGLPCLQNIVNKTFLGLRVRETLINGATRGLQRIARPADTVNMQVAAEKVADCIWSLANDLPFYARGAYILYVFAFGQSQVIPLFAKVSVSGILLYGAIAYVIGLAVSERYDAKQNAAVKLSHEAIALMDDLRKVKPRSELPIFLGWLGSTIETKDSFVRFTKAWQEFRKATVRADVLLLSFNMLLRDLTLEVTKVLSILVLTMYVHDGVLKSGDALFLLGLIPKAAEPFSLWGPMQEKLLAAKIYVEWLVKLKARAEALA